MQPAKGVCIIGAGLSGLALASALKREGHDVIVLEARDRAGGRVLSHNGYDLGPSWVWPHNHRMLALLQRLGLETFAQHTAGRLVFEDGAGRLRRDLEFAMMGGAFRVKGGLAQVTARLAADLGNALQLGCVVGEVREEADGVTVVTSTGTYRAAQVVVALPPRLAAGFGLALPDVPTWMAGHAKLVATYKRPFWRGMGLNGDAISHRGPLAEIHDASPADTGPADTGAGALFGFARVGAARQPDFRDAAIAQLARLFGPEAAVPDEVIVKDWSIDAATSTKADLIPPEGHPAYQALAPTRRVIFAGTEAAPEEGGFLEGALAAAEAAWDQLRASLI